MQELDVRPILKAGGEPIGCIMDFVANVPRGEGFRLCATFKPTPLLTLLRMKGFDGVANEVSVGNWRVDFIPCD